MLRLPWAVGAGALTLWLLLVFTLVNVWLLCAFISLLLVLGSCVGSQALLDSDSAIHLERFVHLQEMPSSPAAELQLDQEVQSMVRKIIRDFVSSWYRTVSSEAEFEMEVEGAMLAMAMELKHRARKVDKKVLAQNILELCGCHLQSYLSACQMSTLQSSDSGLWGMYSHIYTPHPATRSPVAEANYARAIVHLLLHVLVPAPHLETRTGRFVVGELIACNVLLPLVSKLSDPDWLNLLLLDIFTHSGIMEEQMEPFEAPPMPDIVPGVSQSLSPRAQPDLPTVTELPSPELAADALDVLDLAESYPEEDSDSVAQLGEQLFTSGKVDASPMDYLHPGRFNLFYQDPDSDLESPMSDYKKGSVESLIIVGPEEELRDDVVVSAWVEPVEDTPPCPKVQISDVLESSSMERESRPSSFYTNGSGCELSVAPPPAPSSSPTTGAVILSPFSFEPLSSPEGPVLIQNLRISGTITAKEHRGTGSHAYTLYTIKYETMVDSDPENPPPVAYHMVNRRYSEFLNLQTRLEEKAELRKIIKSVKGPKKIFPDLPFGNMDTDKVEARKSLLETFLKQLCAIPETANSEEMQEFLALNTDARIAFVKKPFVVSRIDKIVVNAIVDTLKTAFPRSEPQSPTEDADAESDGKAPGESKKNKSRLRFSSRISPALGLAEVQPKLIYCFKDSSSVFNGLSLCGLEAFITEQERHLSKVPMREAGPLVEVGMASEEQKFLRQSADLPLAGVALDILHLLVRQQWSWLCTENIHKTVRLLFGTFIDRWLEVGVANLTCTQYWVVYLRLLQEAVWPGGVLPLHPRPQRSSQQKEETRQRLLECLMRMLPELFSALLGLEKYRASWQTLLESLQDPQINRHLVYCVWDLLLEALIPESSSEAFQNSLLQSLSGTAAETTGV